MKTIDINSQINILTNQENIMRNFTQEDVKNETMFFSADLEFAWNAGDRITRDFIRSLPDNWRNRPNLILDTRVHMLMKGWLPAIGGYHCDDVTRLNRNDKQPDMTDANWKSEHITALIGGEISATEFIIGNMQLEVPEDGEGVVYKRCHKQIEKMLEDKSDNIKQVFIPSNHLVEFNHNTFHKATKATEFGFRWWARLSSYGSPRVVHNEIRKNANVYIVSEQEGW